MNFPSGSKLLFLALPGLHCSSSPLFPFPLSVLSLMRRSVSTVRFSFSSLFSPLRPFAPSASFSASFTLSSLRAHPSPPVFRCITTSSVASDSASASVSSLSPVVSSASVARYTEHGVIEQVIRLSSEGLPNLGPNDVLIRFLAAPINPADVNMVEGAYHICPPLPAIGGNEGVAEVVQVGPKVTEIRVGDWVIPAQPGFGTWRTHAVCHESAVDYIDNDIPLEIAATVSVNPSTAYRMLYDFVRLEPGDVVIQNGANSGVGQAVIQLAKIMHVRTINIIRDRPNLKETVERLMELGGDIVVTEEQASSRHMKDLIAKLPQPKLGLNCVGGSSSVEIARLLKDGGQMITYGGMSRKPVQLPTGRLIFNDIVCRGFWLSRWTMSHSKLEHQSMIHSLTRLMKQGKLQSAVEMIPFAQFEAALKLAQEGYRDRKIVLKF